MDKTVSFFYIKYIDATKFHKSVSLSPALLYRSALEPRQAHHRSDHSRMHDLDLDVPRFNGRTPLLVLLSLRRHRGLARRGGALGVADHLRVAQRAPAWLTMPAEMPSVVTALMPRESCGYQARSMGHAQLYHHFEKSIPGQKCPHVPSHISMYSQRSALEKPRYPLDFHSEVQRNLCMLGSNARNSAETY